MNKLLEWKACALYNSYCWRYLDEFWYTYISGQDNVLRAGMVAPPCYPFKLSPLNELNR